MKRGPILFFFLQFKSIRQTCFIGLRSSKGYQTEQQRENLLCVYGFKPEVWGRVGPDPRAELQVDPAREPQSQGLGRPGNTSLYVALPEQANSHSSDASYHGEQGYNIYLFVMEEMNLADSIWQWAAMIRQSVQILLNLSCRVFST